MERCVDKSEGQPSKQRKSWQYDYASTNVVRCHWVRQKIFQPSTMLGHGEKLQTIQNYSHGSDRCVE
ncbi:unnamed protein product [Prunus armeniaca]